MFGKLKEKLKKSLSLFSQKAEEEATEETIEVKQETSISEPATEESSQKMQEIEEPSTPVPKETEETAPEPSKHELLDLDADETELDAKELKEHEEAKEDLVLDEIDNILQEEKTEEKNKNEESLPSASDLLSEDINDSIEEEAEKESSNDKQEHSKIPEPSKDELLDHDADETAIDAQELKEIEKQTSKEIEHIAEGAKQKKETTIAAESEAPKEEKKGFFSKIKQKLTTKTINAEKFEELFWELELVLLENNVSVKVIEKIKEDLAEELVDKPLPRNVEGKIQEVLATTLKEILSIEQKNIISEIKEAKTEGKPYIIIFFGINGSGKTTTIAKLGHLLKSEGFSVVLAAGDTFRAAAIDQIQDHATKLDIKLIKHDYGSDAAAVAFDAKQYAEKNNIDVVLIDTAGRLHSNTNLMAELEKMMRVAKPDCKIFIGESITGNDCVEQAEKYTTTLGIDGIILTKADIDEMGGAPLSICYVTGKPILYLGMGQEYKDLHRFTPELILEKLGIK